MSNCSPDDLKYLLLDMLSATREVEPDRFAHLDDQDWRALALIVGQHRIGPMLHHQHKLPQDQWIVPAAITEIWTDAYRKSAMRSLRLQLALRRIDGVLRAADIRYAAMKGAWLFLHAYVQPALRPMRDLDIVVAPENALRAHALLEESGFIRPDEFAKASEYSIELAKHLPPQRCAETGILLEVHTRVVDKLSEGQKSSPLGDTAALLQRSEEKDGIIFLSPTDTMLHLVLHAVYDHQFNNGPLTLNDVALLAASSPIDWPRFWAMAEAGNWDRGAELLFAMARRYHDPALFPTREGSTATPSEGDIESALLLMLQDFDQRQVVAFRAQLANAQSPLGRGAILWQRAFPGPHMRAAASGSPSAIGWILTYYPKWLLARAARFIRMLFDRQVDEVEPDIRRAAQIGSWLQANEKHSA